MSDIHLDAKHQIFWLDYQYLTSKGVDDNTISQWSKRKICTRKYIDGRAYIDYDSIPAPTRAKLPTKEGLKEEYSRQQTAHYEQWYIRELGDAYKSDRVPEWINTILKDEQYSKLKREQVTYFARRAAVIERAAELQSMYSAKGRLSGMFYAYSSIYPNDYSKKNRFCMALKKAREEGVLSVAIDRRLLRVTEPRYTDVHIFLAEGVLSDRRGFDLVVCHEMLQEACNDLNIDTPSIWWLRQYYRKNKNFIDLERMGKTAYEKEHRPYAKIIPALHRNTQWQIDGWEIPIYAKRRNENGGWELYFKYTLFVVMDAHSRKYIGYSIGESENTTVIMEALEHAVRNTGVLPYEIVSDNHSFNKTKEAENFKSELDKIGVHWTVDSNPRRKALLERSFRTLGDKHLKKQYGYIGQGVRSKMKTGRTQQELIDEYTKNASRFPVYEQIVVMTIAAILEYNKTVKPTLKQSPDDRYDKSDQPKCFEIDVFKRIQLFTCKTEQRVSNGQITIKRGMHTYSYQLPSEYMTQYSGKTVAVHYVDFDEIYLYDIETNEPICSVVQKSAIHGSIGDQTNIDTERLFRNSGRIKGNDSKMSKRKDEISNKTNTLSHSAADALNKMRTPKELIKQVERDNRLHDAVTDKAVTISKVATLPEIGILKFDKPQEKVNKHPFAPKGEVKMGKIKIDDWK